MRLHLPARAIADRANFVKQIVPGQRTTFVSLDGPGCIQHLFMCTNRTELCSRRVIVRIYFDGSPVPHVEAPLGDLFGVMHGLQWYPINSARISVKMDNGFNCYFPMPFAESARFEFESPNPIQYVYLQVDWHRYPGQKLEERQRFCARWRRECPTKRYAHDYLMLDADGPGQLAGFAYGVRLMDQVDRWSHGGADNIYLDGQGAEPAYIRGTGGEDTFGTAWGGALHTPETHLYAAMPYYVHEDVSEARPAQRLAGYRFFETDTITFEESLHLRFGCMCNDICSTVYWYQEKPVRPIFTMPDWDKLKAGSELPAGTLDLPLPDAGAWWLCGPFGNDRGQGLAATLPAESAFDPQAEHEGLHGADSPFLNERSRELGRHVARWTRYAAAHGFVDFRHVFRPCMRGASPTYPAVALARGTLTVPSAQTVQVRLAWDDQLVLRLNDGPPQDLGTNAMFRQRTVALPLRAGANTLVLKLSNDVGTNWGGWAFAFKATTADGRELLPAAE